MCSNCDRCGVKIGLNRFSVEVVKKVSKHLNMFIAKGLRSEDCKFAAASELDLVEVVEDDHLCLRST
jgi:hypothetical protein